MNETFSVEQQEYLKGFMAGVEARRGDPPVLVAVPAELGLQRLRHAPAVSEAELGQHGARGDEPEVLDQVLAQQTHGHRVEEDRALPSKADHPVLGLEFEEFLVIEIVGAHGRPFFEATSFEMKFPTTPF